MKIVGLTGGIGAGKSTVSKIFLILGIPVFNCDEESKKIIYSDIEIQRKISIEVEGRCFKNGKPDVEFMRQYFFSHPKKLQKLNAIVHPQVRIKMEQWVKENQHHVCCIIESAILFECKLNQQCDYVIDVYSDKALRIERLKKSRGLFEDMIEKIMSAQMDEDEKRQRSDFVITNQANALLLEQVFDTIEKIKKC